MNKNPGNENQQLDSRLVSRLSRLSLVQTVALVLVLTVTIGTAGFALNLVARYTDDRIPSLMELELERSGRMAFDLKERMDNKTLKAFEASTDRFPIALDRLKLPRFPRYGEVFLSQYEGKFIRIGGTLEGKIWVDMTPFDLEVPAVTQGSFFLITTFGDFVTSSDEAMRLSSGQVTNKDIVRTFFQSGVEQGVRLESSDKGEVIVGFRSVPSTNLVLFFEKPLTGLLEPLNKALLMLALGGAAVALAAGILGYVVLQMQLRPLAKLKIFAIRLVLGHGLRAGALPGVPQRSEFKPIEEAFALLIGRLHSNEGRIFGVVQYIKMLHQFQQKTQSANDFQSIRYALAELSLNLLQPLPQNQAAFVFAHPQVPTKECLAVQNIGQNQGRVSVASIQAIRDDFGVKVIQDYAKINQCVLDQNGAHIPVRVGIRLLGFLSVRNYPNAAHFEIVSPLLTIALGMLSEKVSAHLDWVEAFMDDIENILRSRPQTSPFAPEPAASSGTLLDGLKGAIDSNTDIPQPSDGDFGSENWPKGA